ncbi:MAG: ribosome assembly RNA-binding protein YhbY [Polyangiaceae bacterium]
MSLTGKQTRHLRALGHHLDPVVQIGKNGITEALVAQLAEAIAHHELIKVRLLPECPLDRREAGEEVAAALEAELAQTLGRTLLFWKRNPQSAKVSLPNARGELKLPASQEASKGKKPSSRERAGARKPSAQGERNAPARRARGGGSEQPAAPASRGRRRRRACAQVSSACRLAGSGWGARRCVEGGAAGGVACGGWDARWCVEGGAAGGSRAVGGAGARKGPPRAGARSGGARGAGGLRAPGRRGPPRS